MKQFCLEKEHFVPKPQLAQLAKLTYTTKLEQKLNKNQKEKELNGHT